MKNLTLELHSVKMCALASLNVWFFEKGSVARIKELCIFHAWLLRGPRIFYFTNERVKIMPDYQKLYHKLFNDITDIIEDLKKSQQEAEEMYILSYEEEEAQNEEKSK